MTNSLYPDAEGISFAFFAHEPSGDSAGLHTLKWEADDSTEISPRAVAFDFH